ncbi:MAG: hypothetical protein ACHQ0Y_04975 [Thermodesulfovibrionales bacterium]
MNVLLVVPDWPKPKKLKDPAKYFPYPLLKLAAYHREQGDNVHLHFDDGNVLYPEKEGNLFLREGIPFVPDLIGITTVFSWWFQDYVKPCIEKYHNLYPAATIRIGGVHASLDPDLYREAFPYADVHIGKLKDAEAVTPAYDLLPSTVRTQIDAASSGCIRKCSFCYGWRFGYEEYPWEYFSKRIKMRKLILNDNNIVARSDVETFLGNLADFKLNGKPLSSIEIQGGFDVRILSKKLHLIPLLKACRVTNIRIAWDGSYDMAPMVDKCVEGLDKQGYNVRNIRCFVLYNHNEPFEIIVRKLLHLSKLRIGLVHSRFRPITLLKDGYAPSAKQQTETDYYIHDPLWNDKKIRIIGSLASDTSKLARSCAKDLDDLRSYYGRPSVQETLQKVAA